MISSSSHHASRSHCFVRNPRSYHYIHYTYYKILFPSIIVQQLYNNYALFSIAHCFVTSGYNIVILSYNIYCLAVLLLLYDRIGSHDFRICQGRAYFPTNSHYSELYTRVSANKYRVLTLVQCQYIGRTNMRTHICIIIEEKTKSRRYAIIFTYSIES